MRVKWEAVFETNKGAMSPKMVVQIAGDQMTPGVNFFNGVSCGADHLAKHVGKDLDIEQDEDTGIVTINGFY